MLQLLFIKRTDVYQQARVANPKRWSKISVLLAGTRTGVDQPAS